MLWVPGAAVGAVGVPVKEGDAIVARKSISEVFVVMLAVAAFIAVGKVEIVEELTPPTLLIVATPVTLALPSKPPLV